MGSTLLITSGNGTEIPAEYIRGEESRPVVLMFHGLQMPGEEFCNVQERIADSLNAFGVGSLCMDFRGYGDSKRNLSGHSLASQVEDLMNGVKLVSSERRNAEIIPVGIGFGAPAALVLSEVFCERVKKCVLIAPITDFKSTFLYPKTQWGKEFFGYERVVRGIRGDMLNAGGKCMLKGTVLADILLMDIPDFVKKTEFEICAFHGKCDELVPISSTERLAKLRDHIKCIPLDNTGHGLMEIGDTSFRSPVSTRNLISVVEEIVR